MTKVRTTVTLDEEVLKWVKVRGARLGKGDSVIGGLLLDIELGQNGLRDIKVEWRIYDVALRGDHPK